MIGESGRSTVQPKGAPNTRIEPKIARICMHSSTIYSFDTWAVRSHGNSPQNQRISKTFRQRKLLWSPLSLIAILNFRIPEIGNRQSKIEQSEVLWSPLSLIVKLKFSGSTRTPKPLMVPFFSKLLATKSRLKAWLHSSEGQRPGNQHDHTDAIYPPDIVGGLTPSRNGSALARTFSGLSKGRK